MNSSGRVPITNRLCMVAMPLLLLSAVAPGSSCCHASTEECRCCGTSLQPVSRPMCNCYEGCSCGRPAPTSQAVAKGRIQPRSQPVHTLRLGPLASTTVDSYCKPSDECPYATSGARRCVVFCRLNR